MGNLDRTVDNIDVSSKDLDAREIELTYLNFSISCDGLYKLQDDGFAKLEDAFNNKEKVMVQFAMVDYVYQGFAYITNLSFDIGYEDVVTYSATLEGTSLLEKIEAKED